MFFEFGLYNILFSYHNIMKELNICDSDLLFPVVNISIIKDHKTKSKPQLIIILA